MTDVISTSPTTGSQEPLIRCRDATVSYGGEPILHRVQLEIQPGTRLIVTGPNGSGKTTLLRMLLGLVPLQEGVVETPFASTPAGYVPQHRQLDPMYPVSAFDVAAMGLYGELGWWGRVRGAHRERVEQILRQFELQEHAHKRFAALSGGMMQKVLIARALLSGAEVFVLDEPFMALDQEARVDLLSILDDLSDKGKTLLITLHGSDVKKVPSDVICLVESRAIRLLSRDEYMAWEQQFLLHHHHDGSR